MAHDDADRGHRSGGGSTVPSAENGSSFTVPVTRTSGSTPETVPVSVIELPGSSSGTSSGVVLAEPDAERAGGLEHLVGREPHVAGVAHGVGHVEIAAERGQQAAVVLRVHRVDRRATG